MKVRGKDVSLYVYEGATPVLTVCATNLTKTTTAERINVTTVDSDRENEYIGGSTESEITLDGVRTLDIVGSWQAEDFEDNIGEVLRIIIIYTNQYGDILSYDGNVVVTDVSDNNGASEFSTYSIQMVRSGPWTKLKTYENALVDSNGDFILDSNGDIIRTT